MTSRLPGWLKRSIPLRGQLDAVYRTLSKSSLTTVCEEARCPNLGECFSTGTATFMILGDQCSRTCRFCSVSKGVLKPLDKTEKFRLRDAVRSLNLNYVVITTVTRDDLPDGGSEVIAEIVQFLKCEIPGLKIEVLVPDFNGDFRAVDKIINAEVDVFGHNIEMVPRLYKALRPEADYKRSLDILTYVKETTKIPVKTGIMVGLGEDSDEVNVVLHDLAAINTDIVTIGQYLQPANTEVKVHRYVSPDEFKSYQITGIKYGIRHVESGPFVRSSYRANTIERKLAENRHCGKTL